MRINSQQARSSEINLHQRAVKTRPTLMTSQWMFISHFHSSIITIYGTPDMDDYQQPPLPQEVPAGAFVGFQTASKKAIPPPSATALARARQLLDEDKECAEPPRKRARQEDGELHGIRGYSAWTVPGQLP